MRFDQASKLKWFLLDEEGLDLYSNLCGVRVHRLSDDDIAGYRKRGAKCYGTHAIRIIRYSRATHNPKDIECISEWCDITHDTFRAMSYELRDIRREAMEKSLIHR